MIKLLTFDNLFPHIVKRRGAHGFPPKWRWFTWAQCAHLSPGLFSPSPGDEVDETSSAVLYPGGSLHTVSKTKREWENELILSCRNLTEYTWLNDNRNRTSGEYCSIGFVHHNRLPENLPAARTLLLKKWANKKEAKDLTKHRIRNRTSQKHCCTCLLLSAPLRGLSPTKPKLYLFRNCNSGPKYILVFWDIKTLKTDFTARRQKSPQKITIPIVFIWMAS